ncbi:MAG TPA: methyl-accepting chemotaxis protein [Clostridiales bacterium]|nr:methyl-accepting chemotaxis protein [Clostridiales bacterium]
MKWFYNLKISAKLILAFIIVALIAGMIGLVGIININNINRLDTEMYERHVVQLSELIPVTQGYQSLRVGLREIIALDDIASKNQSAATINENYKAVIEGLQQFGKSIKDPRIKNAYDTFNDVMTNRFPVYMENVIQLAMTNQKDQALNMVSVEGAPLNEEVSRAIDELISIKIELASAASDVNSAAAKTSILTMAVLIIAGVVISMALGMFISRIISNPVKKLEEAADKLALGDVNINIEATTAKDEISKLMQSFSNMIENIRSQAFTAERIAAGDLTVDVEIKSEDDLLGKKLHELVEKNNEVLTSIALASEQVSAGSEQMSESSIALSQGATEQAGSIEELSASIEEISSQTKQNADNASQASRLAESAKANAEAGNQQMREMLKAMQEINYSSTNISKIIKVIDDIAFQTNILALNAAVEAARAGQHGKGFAVVAEEVRNLAARSAEAAKETTDMIENSIKKVESGSDIANETAGALAKIVGDIGQVADLVSNIAAASNEQASGIVQINQGIMQVSEVVQTNSATSEESAAASEELASQASLLKMQVDKFKLKREM